MSNSSTLGHHSFSTKFFVNKFQDNLLSKRIRQLDNDELKSRLKHQRASNDLVMFWRDCQKSTGYMSKMVKSSDVPASPTTLGSATMTAAEYDEYDEGEPANDYSARDEWNSHDTLAYQRLLLNRRKSTISSQFVSTPKNRSGATLSATGVRRRSSTTLFYSSTLNDFSSSSSSSSSTKIDRQTKETKKQHHPRRDTLISTTINTSSTSTNNNTMDESMTRSNSPPAFFKTNRTSNTSPLSSAANSHKDDDSISSSSILSSPDSTPPNKDNAIAATPNNNNINNNINNSNNSLLFKLVTDRVEMNRRPYTATTTTSTTLTGTSTSRRHVASTQSPSSSNLIVNCNSQKVPIQVNMSRSLMRKKQLEIMNEFSKSMSLDVLNRSRRVQQMYNMKVKEFAQQQEEQL